MSRYLLPGFHSGVERVAIGTGVRPGTASFPGLATHEDARYPGNPKFSGSPQEFGKAPFWRRFRRLALSDNRGSCSPWWPIGFSGEIKPLLILSVSAETAWDVGQTIPPMAGTT